MATGMMRFADSWTWISADKPESSFKSYDPADCVEKVNPRRMDDGDGGDISDHEPRLLLRRARPASSVLRSTSKNAKMGVQSTCARSLISARVVARDGPA